MAIRTPLASTGALDRVGEEGGFRFIGQSRFVDCDGELLTAVGADGEQILYADINPEAARHKRDAERGRIETEIERAERKLANEGFVARAPAAVVQAERDKLARLRADLEAL